MKKLLEFWSEAMKYALFGQGVMIVTMLVVFVFMTIKASWNYPCCEEQFIKNIMLWVHVTSESMLIFGAYNHYILFRHYLDKQYLLLPASMEEKYYTHIAIAFIIDAVMVVAFLVGLILTTLYYKFFNTEYVFGGQLFGYVVSNYLLSKYSLLFICVCSLATLLGIIWNNKFVVAILLLFGFFSYFLFTFFHELPGVLVCGTYIVLTLVNFYLAYLAFKRRCINTKTVTTF